MTDGKYAYDSKSSAKMLIAQVVICLKKAVDLLFFMLLIIIYS